MGDAREHGDRRRRRYQQGQGIKGISPSGQLRKRRHERRERGREREREKERKIQAQRIKEQARLDEAAGEVEATRAERQARRGGRRSLIRSQDNRGRSDTLGG